MLEAPNALQLLVYDSMAFLADHTEARHCRRRLLLLFDVLVKDFRDLARTLLRVSLLSSLVVDIGHAETRRIALGPLEIATKKLMSAYILVILLLPARRTPGLVQFEARRKGSVCQSSSGHPLAAHTPVEKRVVQM